jgi:prepilin-type N-terminal cleavage/methylation domain-containing protein
MCRNKRGFAMVELAIAIAVLGLIAVVTIPRYMDMVTEAQTSTCAGVRAAITADLVHPSPFTTGAEGERSVVSDQRFQHRLPGGRDAGVGKFGRRHVMVARLFDSWPLGAVGVTPILSSEPLAPIVLNCCLECLYSL